MRLGFLDPDFEGTTGYPVYNFHKQQIFSRSIFFFLIAPTMCWALYQAWEYRDD